MEVSLTMEEVQGLQFRVSELNRQQFILSVLQKEFQSFAGEVAQKHNISAPFEVSSDLTKFIKKEEVKDAPAEQPSPA